MEVKAIEDLYWSIIVSQKYGIHVYSDTSLIDYVYSIPYQSKITIKNRLYVDGCYVYEIDPILPQDKKYYIGVDLFHYMYNLLPIMLKPIRHVLFGRIINTDGVLVRKTKEIYSPVIGVLNINARIYIKNKDFSTIPTVQNIARYELINNKGWINVTNGSVHNVYIEGYVPFDEKMEELQMTIIDFENTCFIKEDKDYDKCIVCLNQKPDCVFIHGNTGHSICCVHCGNNIMKKKMKCPMCRQKIEKLIHLF
jgi:E3 ubiquitin-protein ligase Mdm2